MALGGVALIEATLESFDVPRPAALPRYRLTRQVPAGRGDLLAPGTVVEVEQGLSQVWVRDVETGLEATIRMAAWPAFRELALEAI